MKKKSTEKNERIGNYTSFIVWCLHWPHIAFNGHTRALISIYSIIPQHIGCILYSISVGFLSHSFLSHVFSFFFWWNAYERGACFHMDPFEMNDWVTKKEDEFRTKRTTRASVRLKVTTQLWQSGKFSFRCFSFKMSLFFIFVEIFSRSSVSWPVVVAVVLMLLLLWLLLPFFCLSISQW